MVARAVGVAVLDRHALGQQPVHAGVLRERVLRLRPLQPLDRLVDAGRQVGVDPSDRFPEPAVEVDLSHDDALRLGPSGPMVGPNAVAIAEVAQVLQRGLLDHRLVEAGHTATSTLGSWACGPGRRPGEQLTESRASRRAAKVRDSEYESQSKLEHRNSRAGRSPQAVRCPCLRADRQLARTDRCGIFVPVGRGQCGRSTASEDARIRYELNDSPQRFARSTRMSDRAASLVTGS